jgi:tetratricopeptide (TPR) repeat protein
MQKVLVIALLLFLLGGCAQSLYFQGSKYLDEGQYDRAIDKFYEELKVNPKSSKAWRELGIAFYEKGNLIKADDALTQANNIRPDARANLYIGLIYEKQQDYSKAVMAYAASLNMEPSRKTEAMIRSHLDRLISKKIKQEAVLAIKNEKSINVDTIPENSIAVVRFDGSQLSPELAPIGMGLAEFTTIDLAKVTSLNVVDRFKIDVILDELRLSSSEYADPAFSPRMGRLMGSRKIITGSVLSGGDNIIRLDGAIVNTLDGSTEMTEPSEGELESFFRIQKDFVFKIIDSLDIDLTIEERDAIREVPTESFLAFMAFSRGLKYQSLGMYNEAQEEFKTAVSEDVNFQQASMRNQKISSMSGDDRRGTPDESFGYFESSVTTESNRNTRHNQGLDQTQTNTLFNSGFIRLPQHRDSQQDNKPVKPPASDPGTGTVIIKGDFDAN